MSNPKIELFAELLEQGRQATLKVARAIPEGARLYQPAPGRATPLWLVGHMANTLDRIARSWMLGQNSIVPPELGKIFAPDFAGGTPPSTDASMYPPYDEVLALYDQVMGRTVEGVHGMQDAELGNPLKGNVPEPLRVHFSSNQATLGILVSHDAYHRGQIGLLGKLGAGQ